MSTVFTKILKVSIVLGLAGLLSYGILLFLNRSSGNDQIDLKLKQASAKVTTEKGYEILPGSITSKPAVQALMAQDPGRVQLINFFSYGCHGCALWHPFLQKWATQHADKIVVYHVPILFNKAWEPFARVYFLAKALKGNDTLDTLLFKVIQARELDLSNKKTLAAFFEKQGVPERTFEDLYDSFSINQDLLKAKDLALAYQISLSPSVVLNTPRGSYLITPYMLNKGSGEALLHSLDTLLASTGGT